jgi:hypothetical protein
VQTMDLPTNEVDVSVEKRNSAKWKKVGKAKFNKSAWEKKLLKKDQRRKKEIRRGYKTVEVRRNGGRGAMHLKKGLK